MSTGTTRILDGTILLRSGRYVDPLRLVPDDIAVEDIAQGLAFTCRFSGQCYRYYSVAEHSLLVSRLVAPAYELAALLHDAAEAYLGDIPTPLKYQQSFAFFRKAEERGQAAIAERFGLRPEELHDPVIRHADLVALAIERRDLMPPEGTWPGLPEAPRHVTARILSGSSPATVAGHFEGVLSSALSRNASRRAGANA